jgi:hypothetical protein
MVWITIDLKDGDKPLGFRLSEKDSYRFRTFIDDLNSRSRNSEQQKIKNFADEFSDEQMADVGRNLMKAVSAHAYKDWHPNNCPSEIVGDLRGLCDELKEDLKSLEKDAGRYRFLRDEDNWGDDNSSPESDEIGSSRWGILGELHAGEFDNFIDEAMRS